ncbi:hypothetical protein B0H15DRAFT_946418 [Mycena belliarum]|uniref:Uncharacterized protein n=1 Tax=Mycena belliarum TaxID=1033014 RepID=A0AAD6UAQ2_9AGAR|nr:hypothetical protein B0H15DRAFT_946418 [Mycena belliae]
MAQAALHDLEHRQLADPALTISAVPPHSELLDQLHIQESTFRYALLTAMLHDLVETMAWVQRGLEFVEEERTNLHRHSDELTQALTSLYEQQEETLQRIRDFTSSVTNATISAPIPDTHSMHQVTDDAADKALEKLQRSAVSRQRRAMITQATLQPEAEQDAFIAEVEQWLSELDSIEHPTRAARRLRHMILWRACVNLFSKNKIPLEDTWNADTIRKYALFYIPFVFGHTDSLPSRRSLKASTVNGWNKSLIENIARYATNPDGSRAGMTLLTHENLFQKLREVLINLIRKKDLDRNLNPKHYYGRAEVHLIIKEILSAPQSDRRHGLQLVLTCGHIQIFRLPDRFGFRMSVHIDQLKGSLDTVESQELHFILLSVLTAANLPFDPTVWFLVFLYVRGALDVKDFEELFLTGPDAPAEIKIKPEFRDIPLFVQVANGQYTKSPLSARAIGQLFAYWAMKAGLPSGGLTTLRRDFGNYFNKILGARIAQDLLNHAIEGIFRRHYSRNVANINVVHLRLGEVASAGEAFPGEELQKALGAHSYFECAVEALVVKTREITERDPTVPDPHKTAHPALDMEAVRLAKAEAKLNPNYVMAETAWDAALDNIFSFFSWQETDATKKIRKGHQTLQTRFAHNIGIGKKLLDAAADPNEPICLKPDVDVNALKIKIEELKVLKETYNSAKSKSRKYAKGLAQRAATRAIGSTSASGTTGERSAALEALQRDSSILDAATVASAAGPPMPNAKAGPSQQTSTAQKDAQEAPVFTHTDYISTMTALESDPGILKSLVVPDLLDVDTADEDPSTFPHELLDDSLPPGESDEHVDPANIIAIDPQESEEQCIFGVIDIDGMRKSIMRWVYQPILDYDAEQALLKTLKNTSVDPTTGDTTDAPKFAQKRQWNNHTLRVHSEWAVLLPAKPDAHELFRCPAGDYSSPIRDEVMHHLTSDICSLKHVHRKMLSAYHESMLTRYKHPIDLDRARTALNSLASGGSGQPPVNDPNHKLACVLALLSPSERAELDSTSQAEISLVETCLAQFM